MCLQNIITLIHKRFGVIKQSCIRANKSINQVSLLIFCLKLFTHFTNKIFCLVYIELYQQIWENVQHVQQLICFMHNTQDYKNLTSNSLKFRADFVYLHC